jgi:hypothetical protein
MNSVRDPADVQATGDPAMVADHLFIHGLPDTKSYTLIQMNTSAGSASYESYRI